VPEHPGSVAEVAAAFLKLGVSSFGGPIAHIGYFHREFVQRRRWLDEQQYAQLLALCQFLPGPASSQLGFALGLLRAGWLGALTAFLAFTLPSALLLFAFAAASDQLDGPWGQGTIHGLKLAAVAIVAQAVVAMARTLTPDRRRVLIALAVAAVMLISRDARMQLLLVASAAVLGPWLCQGVVARNGESFRLPYGRRTGSLLLFVFSVLLALAMMVAPGMSPMSQTAGAFYRAGALVFGGGHVVLPMLQQAVVAPGWLDNDTFLAGYGAAQAVPGPMFAMAAFLGERVHDGQGGALGATIGLLAVFLPGLLLVAGALPFWRVLGAQDSAARILAGVNAAVVGLLAAALYDPVLVSTVHDIKDAAIALAAFVLLSFVRWPPMAIVCACAAVSILFEILKRS
jgi:chromate transporter